MSGDGAVLWGSAVGIFLPGPYSMDLLLFGAFQKKHAGGLEKADRNKKKDLTI